jgi:type VI secretion system secreted protein Hcp
MTKTILLLSVVIGSVLLGGALHDNAFAAVDMFLKIEGIDGEASDKNHEGEIDVLSWSWGMTQSGSAGGGAGKVNVQDLSFTKFIDKSTPKLYEKLANGEHIPEIKLSISDKKYSGNETYLTYTLTDVLVSSVSTGGSDGKDRPTESISLNFEKIKITYQPFENKKKSGTAISFTLLPDRIE